MNRCERQKRESEDARVQTDLEIATKPRATSLASLDIESRALWDKDTDTGSHACEDEGDDLWWMELLFMICLLPTKQHSSRNWRLLNAFICLHSTFLGYGGAAYILIIRMFKEGYYIQLFAVVWSIAMSTVYIFLSYHQRQTPDLIDRLREISLPPTHPLLHRVSGLHFTDICKYPVLISISAWLLNVVFSLLNVRTIVEQNFGISENIGWIIYVIFFSFYIHILCWFMPMPIIYTGCYYLTSKVKAMYDVFHTELTKGEGRDSGNGSGNDPDLVALGQLYSEIYELNRLLNHCVSFLFTFVLATLAFVSIFIILAFLVNSGGFPVSVLLLWNLMNICVLGPLCFAAAGVDAWNKKFRYKLGDFTLRASTPGLVLLQYQTLQSKVAACPMGVHVYGILYEVSFAALGALSSLWVSVFLAVAGVVRMRG